MQLEHSKKELEERLQRMNEKQADIQRAFLAVFNNELGQKVIDYLDDYSHFNYPNFENVNATYAKAGQQQLVDHIRGVLDKAKKGGK